MYYVLCVFLSIWFLQQAAKPFFLLAGPNVIESEEHVLKMAKHIKAITTKWARSGDQSFFF
jgi:3-deoxy-D-manno-octulosonic acid (KDO) 8-phosphate synthase